MHKFPYIKGSPKITAKLSTKAGVFKYFQMLVDSGADYTIISRSDALFLDIEYDKIGTPEKRLEFGNLAILHAKSTPLTIWIRDEEFTIPVLVVNGNVECTLGRKGVFDNFDILFQERKQQVLFKRV